ncbi:MAG: hypothetical protein NZ554_08320, partial [Bryobacteraceae bacterium]|nr:hypothetical protein [Bryobacteraceae bacterium]
TLLALSLAATAMILVLPPVLARDRGCRPEGIRPFLAYFVALGAGYILIQVGLVQKFILLLGSPTSALSVIVFSMLVASGLGSCFSARLAGPGAERLGRVLAGIAGMIGALALLSGPLCSIAVAWPAPAKVALTVMAVAPPAFLMGVPFPTGLAQLERRHRAAVRWAWALNAAASVLGSVAAVALGLCLGLRETLLVGGLLYVAAWAATQGWRGRESVTELIASSAARAG